MTKRKPQYVITLVVEAYKLTNVEAAAQLAFPGNVRSVRKVDLAKSRTERLAQVAMDVSQSIQDVTELQEELQEWLDSMPENMQSGQKASDIQDAIDALESIKDELEAVNFDDVSFPDMMG